MSAAEWIGLILAGMVMLLGLIGTVVPGIPGAPLVLVAAVGHKLYFREASVSYFALAVMIFFMVLSLVLEFLASVLGAKKLGATWRGMLGAVVGAIVGLFFSLPGLILGPILGAFLFELAGGRQWKESAKAGTGALIGLVLGTIGKVGCCVVMIAVFCFSLLRSENVGPPPLPGTDETIALERSKVSLLAFHFPLENTLAE